jgi:hypothetical protein
VPSLHPIVVHSSCAYAVGKHPHWGAATLPLTHANVLHRPQAAASFKRASSRLASRSLNERRPGGSGRSSADAPPARARQHETWILLELCNAGSLQV